MVNYFKKIIKEIDNKVAKISEHINNYKYRSFYINDLPKWNRICLSLDNIEDSSLGILSFCDKNKFLINDLYLSIYGVYNAIYIQNASVRFLSKEISLNTEEFENREKNIINNRNKIIHPDKKEDFYFISRISMSNDKFDIVKYNTKDNKENFSVESIGIKNDIDNHLKNTSYQLDLILKELEKIEENHKEAFKMKKLTSILDNGITYAKEKMHWLNRASIEEIKRDNLYTINLLKFHINTFLNNINTFEEELKKRNLDVCEYEINNIKKAISELLKYINEKKSQVIFDNVYIYVNYIFYEFENIKKYAIEIDEDYNS